MTFLVPFDGSPLSLTALDRAVRFAEAFDESVLAVAVVPRENPAYARERGWIDADDPFDLETVVSGLRARISEHAPAAEFGYEQVPRDAHAGSIAGALRRVADRVGASMVFVGSENAGRLVTTLSSVGGTVAADPTYDVVIVRHARERADEE